MRMRITAVIAMLLVALLVAGCGNKSDKVIGVWKSAKMKNGRHEFIEIAKEKIDIDGNVADVVLEDKDGKVSIRIAGRDDVIGVISVIDDKNIEINFSGMMVGKIALVKSSKEERTTADHPPVEAILGYWRYNDGASDGVTVVLLEIGKDRIAYGSEKSDLVIETKKGLYSLSTSYYFTGVIARTDDNTIEVNLSEVRGTFTRLSKEEADAITEKNKALLQPYSGMWRSAFVDDSSKEFSVLEIGDDFIVQNGKKSEATLSVTTKGLKITYGEKGKLSLSLTDKLTASVSPGWDSVTYYRTSPEDMEMVNNINIANFEGMWILDSDVPTYKALAIDSKNIYRDGLKQTFEVVSYKSQLNLVPPGNKKHALTVLSHAGSNRIAVINNANHYEPKQSYYKRATKEEFAKALEGMVDLFSVIPGYWRSAEPVTSRGAYATVFVQYNIPGEKVEGICDRVEHHFLSPSARNGFDRHPNLAEGFIGYPDGDKTYSIGLLTPDDDSRWYVHFDVLDINTMNVIAGSSNTVVKMTRSTKEENDKLREEAIKRF